MQCFSPRDLFKTARHCGNSAAVKTNRLGDLRREWQCILRDCRLWSASRCSSQCEKPFMPPPAPRSLSPYIKFSLPHLIPYACDCFFTLFFRLHNPKGKCLPSYNKKNKLYKWLFASNYKQHTFCFTLVCHIQNIYFLILLTSHELEWLFWLFQLPAVLDLCFGLLFLSI